MLDPEAIARLSKGWAEPYSRVLLVVRKCLLRRILCDELLQCLRRRLWLQSKVLTCIIREGSSVIAEILGEHWPTHLATFSDPVLGTKYLVPSPRYWVLDTWYQGLGIQYLVPSTWYEVLGTKYLVLSTWYKYLAPSSAGYMYLYQVLGTWSLNVTNMSLNVAKWLLAVTKWSLNVTKLSLSVGKCR